MNDLLLAIEVVLILTAVAFCLVRIVTPEFRGLGWLGGAFAAASLCPVVLLTSLDTFGFDVVSLLILITFALVHLAVTTLTDKATSLPRLTILLLLAQGLLMMCVQRGLVPVTFTVISRNLLLAVQVVATAVLARTIPKAVSRVPQWTLMLPLVMTALLSVAQLVIIFHAGLPAIGTANDHENEMRALLIAALSVFAFGFFWRSTLAHLTQLEESGGTDALTELLNRRHFLIRCEQELENYRRRTQTFSIMMVDIDHFKSINDTFGHPVGDIVIQDVVERVRDAVRGIDTVGRWGGEEFIVLLKDCPLERAAIAAERLRFNVERMDCTAAPIRFGSQQKITVSIGIADFKGQETILDLISRADQGLYRAKRNGRNRVEIASRDGNEEAEKTDKEAVLSR